MPSQSLYDLLGVAESTSDAEIKAAYRQKMKVLHPDRGGSDDAAKQVNAAYEILSDAERRADYDRFANGAPCPTCGRLFKDRDLAVQHTMAHEMKRTAPPRPSRAGVGRIVIGAGLAAFGLLTTFAAVSSDQGGVIWYGAIIAGGLMAFQGVNLFVASGHIRDAYDEIMAEVNRVLRLGTDPSAQGAGRATRSPHPARAAAGSVKAKVYQAEPRRSGARPKHGSSRGRLDFRYDDFEIGDEADFERWVASDPRKGK